MITFFENIHALCTLKLAKVTEPFSPSLAARIFSRIWFRVHKMKSHTNRSRWVSLCTEVRFHHRQKEFKAFHSKVKNPRGIVILIHGWSGRFDQFSDIALQLHREGFETLSFDLPAHAENHGNTSDIFEFAEFISNLHSKMNLNDHVVICHSAGFLAWSLFSRERSIMSQKLILVGSPGSFSYLIDSFKMKLGFSNALVEKLWEVVAQRGRIQNPKEHLDVGHMRKIKDEKVLLIHDKSDRTVDIGELTKLEAIWPKARIIITEGLGHNRILSDPSVIDEMTNFIRDKHS